MNNYPSRFGPDMSPASAHRIQKLPDEMWEKIISDVKVSIGKSRMARAYGTLSTLVIMNYAYLGEPEFPAERENLAWLWETLLEEYAKSIGVGGLAGLTDKA